ncbi:MAG: hypothetical protein OHK0046_07260 [Anaerolineae bacterium]
MIKAVLLDLDNTLLVNPDHVFAVEFMRLVDAHVEKAWQFRGISTHVRQSLQAMLMPRTPPLTNYRLAVDVLSSATGRPTEDVLAIFEQFYLEAYSSLRQCVKTIAVVPDLVAHLQTHGYSVVIATNPVYPAVAIQQRLAWAGLSERFEDYAFVTHAENMHFAKPNPAYYAEILARVGVEPDEAVMVGDSLINDMEPAGSVGLHTYHIDRDGTLADFYDVVVNHGWLENRVPFPLFPAMIEPQYRGNVAALYGMLDGIKPHFWMQYPDPKEWSIEEIVCHLLTSENTVQRPRLERILHEDDPFLAQPRPPLGPRLIKCTQQGSALVEAFVQAREATIAFIQALQPEDWMRPARHSIFGLTTLLEMAHFTAQHDRLHLNQLCQTLGKCE